MSRLLIRRGRVIDPSQSFDRRTDLLLDDGRVAAYDAVDSEADVIDADGCLVVPGLIDLGAELREPVLVGLELCCGICYDRAL